jgi:quercetin dioxygenase-like cupin family protein
MTIVGDGERMTLIRFDSDPGAVTPEHTHPHEQIGTCIRGRGKMTSGVTVLTIEPGVTWIIPPGEPHSFAVEGAEPMLLFEVFSPPREDFLKASKP